MTSRDGAAMLFVFKAQGTAIAFACATEAATPKTMTRTSRIGELCFDGA